MSDYQTDDEKVEELKAWWKENGTSVIVGVALAVAALFGWDYWKQWKENTATTASALYAQVADATTTSVDKALPTVAQLQKDYASTPYASAASLKIAQKTAEQGNYEQAVTALNWVINNASDDEYKHIATIRLARVLLAMNKPEEALKLASQTFPKSYESLVEELKGDVYVAQNKPADARTAYDKAMATNTSGSSSLIKMKRDNLGQG